MNRKIIPVIGAGFVIIAVILVAQNTQIDMNSDKIKTQITNIEMNTECVLEFKKAFPNENENVIKNLCDNSEFRNELYPFTDKININSYGFRGAEFSSKKPIDTYRIFLVGGSTMWGSGNSSDETTIPGILQKIFDKQELVTNIEVINAGLSGANTVTESTLIKERLVDFQPDLIMMYDGWNDLRSEYNAETIYNNWKSICEFGNDNGFHVVTTLQPITGFGNKILTKQEHVNALTGNNHNDTQLLLQKNQYDEYANKLKELSSCTKTKDLRNSFDDISGSIFWDQGHTADAGNMIIAEKMYEISLPIIQKNLPTHKIFHDILTKYNNPTTVSYLLEQYGIERSSKIMTKDVEEQDGIYFSLKEKIGVGNILVGKDLTNIDLSNMKLVDQDLTGANLAGQDLQNIDITGTILRNVDFTNSNLSGLDLSSKDLTGSIFDKTDLSGTILFQTECKYCKISNMDFSNSHLEETAFTSSTITESNFSNMRIKETAFAFADISNTDFSNSNLSFTPRHLTVEKINLNEIGMSVDHVLSMEYSDVEKAIQKSFWGYELAKNLKYIFTSLKVLNDNEVMLFFHSVTTFHDAKLTNVNFSNSDLRLTGFSGAVGESIDFTNASRHCFSNSYFCTSEVFWVRHGEYGIMTIVFKGPNGEYFHTNDEICTKETNLRCFL